MNVLRRSECNIKENVPSNSPKLVWPLEDPSKDSYLPAELRHSLTGLLSVRVSEETVVI